MLLSKMIGSMGDQPSIDLLCTSSYCCLACTSLIIQISSAHVSLEGCELHGCLALGADPELIPTTMVSLIVIYQIL